MHRLGVVHLDIKPGNIYITQQGRPVLLDFGAAEVKLGDQQNPMVIGTPPFMPIEQAEGKDIGEATDIYACAAVLYRMITGDNPPASETRIGNDTLCAPCKLISKLSPVLNRAILRGLAVQKHQRPQSAREFQEMLGGGSGDGTAETLPSKARETLAREIHRLYVADLKRQGQTQGDNASLMPWRRLPLSLKESNRDQAHQLEAQIKMIGCAIVPGWRWWRRLLGWVGKPFTLTEQEIEYLAEREHERWFQERKHDGWSLGPVKDIASKAHPALVPWRDLGEEMREINRAMARRIPELLRGVGYGIRRLSE